MGELSGRGEGVVKGGAEWRKNRLLGEDEARVGEQGAPVKRGLVGALLGVRAASARQGQKVR